MSNNSQILISEASYLTLHYRLSTLDGVDIVTTFNEGPATLQMGQGQLAPFLEHCLIGLPEGTHKTFDLQPEQAFGLRNPELIQLVSMATLNENSAPDEHYAIGDMVEFAAPAGGKFAGILREFRGDGALFDFNHPLAGQSVKFEVKVIGVL